MENNQSWYYQLHLRRSCNGKSKCFAIKRCIPLKDRRGRKKKTWIRRNKVWKLIMGTEFAAAVTMIKRRNKKLHGEKGVEYKERDVDGGNKTGQRTIVWFNTHLCLLMTSPFSFAQLQILQKNISFSHLKTWWGIITPHCLPLQSETKRHSSRV